MNKKTIFRNLIFLLVFCVLAIPLAINAETTLDKVKNNIINAATTIAGAAVVVLLIYTGIMFLTAEGDPEKLKTAKNAFLWAVVGIAIIIGARILSSIIGGLVWGGGG